MIIEGQWTEEMIAEAEEIKRARDEAFMAGWSVTSGNCAMSPGGRIVFYLDSATWVGPPLIIDTTPAPPAEDCCPHCGGTERKDLQLFSSVTQVCAGCGQ